MIRPGDLVVIANVAPRRGAWIETIRRMSRLDWIGVIVAPRRGAWIETVYRWTSLPNGLVAPRRGAWIETG